MSNPNVKTVANIADRIKVAAALAVFAAGVVTYLVLPSQDPIPRLAAFVGGLVLALIVMVFSGPGKRFIAYGKDSYHEARRVVWPSRKETVTMTGIVFAFVVVMSLFLWLTDKSIEWILYGIILGWK